MAKVLISSLGTGSINKDSDEDYKKTIYKIDGKEYPEVLTSKVLIEHLKIEKVFFIGTNKSMWDNIYYHFNGEDENYLDTLSQKKEKGLRLDDLKEVNSCLDNYLKTDSSKSLLIEYKDNNEDEVWKNFEYLLEIKNYLKDEDEIYLDITHGFRYMPILNIFLLEFLTTFATPKINIKGVFYGMFSDKYSEIIDFKIFFDLLEWSKAVHMFKHNANADKLILLLSQDSDHNDVAKVLTQFSNNLQLANMSSLWQFIKDANKKVKALKNSNNKIIQLLSDELVDIVQKLDQETQSKFQFELSKWLYENKNYALSYIALYEAVITRSCEIKKFDIDNHDQREKAKRSIGNDKYGKYFYTKYDNSISQIRNSIVHQSNERTSSVKPDIERLSKFFDTFKEYFNN